MDSDSQQQSGVAISSSTVVRRVFGNRHDADKVAKRIGATVVVHDKYPWCFWVQCKDGTWLKKPEYHSKPLAAHEMPSQSTSPSEWYGRTYS